MPDEPLDHIERACLPWRNDALTECGRPLADVKAWITRDAYIARLKEHGSRRTAFTVCQTCASCIQHTKTWQQSPAAVIQRESGKTGWFGETDEGKRLSRELRAIAALIEAHRDEFDDYLTGLDATINLADRARVKRTRERGAR